MKRYMIFAGMRYYPEGGINDFAGYANEYEEAINLAKAKYDEYQEAHYYCWVHIYDCQTEKIIFKIN
jgi:hypothetical protein